MPMETLGLEIGSWADCMAAVAAAASAALSIRALTIAKDANRTAELTRRESAEAAKEALELDRERERRAVAGALQAWWGSTELEPGRTSWGVIVSNEGTLSTVFHDVKITCRGNKYGGRIKLTVVPPGRYFVATGDHERAWQLPTTARPPEEYTYLIKSEKHAVDLIAYTDPIGTRWEWTPQEGLVEKLPEVCRAPAGSMPNDAAGASPA